MLRKGCGPTPQLSPWQSTLFEWSPRTRPMPTVLLRNTPARQTKYVDLHGFNSIFLIYVHIDHVQKPHMRHIAPEAWLCSSGGGLRAIHAGIHAVGPVQGVVAGLADAVVQLDLPVVPDSVPQEWALAMFDGHHPILLHRHRNTYIRALAAHQGVSGRSSVCQWHRPQPATRLSPTSAIAQEPFAITHATHARGGR